MVATWQDRKFEAGEAIAPKLLLLGLLRPEGRGVHTAKKGGSKGNCGDGYKGKLYL